MDELTFLEREYAEFVATNPRMKDHELERLYPTVAHYNENVLQHIAFLKAQNHYHKLEVEELKLKAFIELFDEAIVAIKQILSDESHKDRAMVALKVRSFDTNYLASLGRVKAEKEEPKDNNQEEFLIIKRPQRS